MADPLGLIGNTGGVQPVKPQPPAGPGGPGGAGRADGPSFQQMLKRELDEVNQLQRDAEQAVNELSTGQRDDIEGVILATQKADTAFRMLLQVRNKMMDAYDEVKQIRV